MIATLLGHPATTRESVPHALRVFDHVRRPLAEKVWHKSRLNGQYFTFSVNSADFSNLKGEQLWGKLQMLGKTFTKNWEWSWTTSIDSSMREALHLLEAWFILPFGFCGLFFSTLISLTRVVLCAGIFKSQTYTLPYIEIQCVSPCTVGLHSCTIALYFHLGSTVNIWYDVVA